MPPQGIEHAPAVSAEEIKASKGTFVPIEEETLDGHAEAAADERASLAKPKPGRPMKEDTVQ
jgi:hypothetical protein